MTEPRDLPLKLAKEFLNLRQKYGTPTGRADWDIFQDLLNQVIDTLQGEYDGEPTRRS